MPRPTSRDPDTRRRPGDAVRGASALFAGGRLGPIHLATLALLYLVCAFAGHFLSPSHHALSVFWLPAAVYAGALVLRPRGDWPLLVAAGALPASVVFHLAHGRSALDWLVLFAANTATALVCASLLARYGEAKNHFRSASASARTFWILAVAPGAGAAIAAANFAIAGGDAGLLAVVAFRWISDITGLCALFPVLVIGAESRPRIDGGLLADASLPSSLLLAITVWLFLVPAAIAGPTQRMIWVLLPLFWLALRFGRRGAALGALAVALVGSWGTARGLGLLGEVEPMSVRVLTVQLAICVCAAVAVTLAASVRSRDRAVDEARSRAAESEGLAADLGRALEEIRTLQGLIPICSHCRKLQSDAGTWQVLEKYLDEHTDARLTHGLCPECSRELYPDYAEGDESA